MDFSQLAFEFQWEQCFSLIDKWKTTMIEHINTIHEEKFSQIQFYKDQAEKDFTLDKRNFILNMNECFQHPCILSDEINTFKNKLNQLKQNIIHRPLPLNIQIEPYSLENSIIIHPILEKNLFKNRKILAEYQIQSIRLIATSNNQIVLINNQSKIFFYDKFLGLINEINIENYTNEYLNDICWSDMYQTFLFLFDHSLWSTENCLLKKLAHIRNKNKFLNYLTSFKNYIYLIYNQGEFIDRWRIEPEWKLDKRWMKSIKNQSLVAVYSNNNYLLFYTNKSIQLCTEDLIIQYTIDLSQQEHLYSNFIYLSTYQIWLFVDKYTDLLKYFHINNRIIQSIDQISIQAISLMEDNDIALITNDHLQIISI